MITPNEFMSLVKHRIGRRENWIYDMADKSSSGDIVVPLRKANADGEKEIKDKDLVLKR